MSFGVAAASRPQHDRRGDVLTQRGVGDGKGYGLCHRRMFQEHFVDFLRGDFLPTAIDDLPYAAREKQVPVVIEETKIARLEPIACKRGLGRHWVAVVARHDACAPDDDLAGLAAGQQSPSFVHDRDVQIHRYADRTGLALARRQRIARDGRGSGFRHPVELDHGGLESLLQFREDARRQRSRRGADEAQPTVRQLARDCAERGRELLDAWSAPRSTTSVETSVSHAKKLLTSHPGVHTTLAPAASEASTVSSRPCP